MLTGLPNRTRFSEQAEWLLRAVEHEPISWGIAVLDLDLFNEINTPMALVRPITVCG
ncbi:diguanylate cyclase domain-containing protein [Acidithiobacillus ferrooxidans]|uniref:diguanylate cyclase domain-containing protein n=1 Tax=Acidithiobacillus ferrooxidans TaxID=920 RepID=UPI000AC9DCBC